MNRQSFYKNSTMIVGTHNVKICPLCGTLNYEGNSECFTCTWQGEFSRDTKTLEMAWTHLSHRCEDVRLEHVTGGHTKPVGDFGRVERMTPMQSWANQWKLWWQRLLSQRRLRCAQREASLRAHASPRAQ